MAIKPILFNTEEVKAILDGRKTVTRRVVKSAGWNISGVIPWGEPVPNEKGNVWFSVYKDRQATVIPICAPYHTDDTLWVRETWAPWVTGQAWDLRKYYLYKADGDELFVSNWRPSIHMPREAARIFLRVTDVRVERLHEIDAGDCIKEGIPWEEVTPCVGAFPENPAFDMDAIIGEKQQSEEQKMIKEAFAPIWDATIKPTDRERYSWDANPWVWVISFERCEMPEGWPI